MSELQHLLKTKQYYAAAWRVIDASDRPLGERKPLEKVDEIVREAIANRVDGELRKILKAFTAFIGDEAATEAAMYLAETTLINVQEDDIVA